MKFVWRSSSFSRFVLSAPPEYPDDSFFQSLDVSKHFSSRLFQLLPL